MDGLATHATVCAVVRPRVLHADDTAYFQTSGAGLKLGPALEEAVRWTRHQARGPALPAIAAEVSHSGRQAERTRAAVAATLGCSADEVMLNECCAVGLNVVAQGIDWHRGDVVVLTEHEHPSNRIPWYALAQRHGVELAILGQQAGRDQPAAELLEELAAELAARGERVRLVSVSHVSRRTGDRLPVETIVALARPR
jgi:selenocysteine lyase/cysteine desulfurase